MIKLPKELSHLEEFAQYASIVRKGIYRFNIPQWKKNGALNKQWLEFRNHVLGASSVGSVLGLSKWKSAYSLFDDKVNYRINETKTQLMLAGSVFESHIADWWKCWDGEKTWLNNVYDKKLVRKANNVNGFIINVKYPAFAVSFDRMVLSHQINPHTGELIKFSYPLEIKNLSRYNKSQNIDPQYLAQMLIQAKVWEAPMVEFVANVGNADLMVVNLDLRDTSSPTTDSLLNLQELIVNEGQRFMDNVAKTREIKKKMLTASTEEEMAKLTETLQNLEPEVDYLASTTESLLLNKGEDEVELTLNDREAKELIALHVNGNHLEKEGKKLKDLAKNRALQTLDCNGVLKFDGGYVSYKPKSETRSRSYYKFQAPEDTEINENIKKTLEEFSLSQTVVI